MAPIVHSQRLYQSFPGASYILPSDATEKDRLLLQHELLKGAFEGRLIICPALIQSGDCILDSGAGSGSWLLDILKEVPTSTAIYAVDIEPKLFPVDEKLIISRGNIHFKTATITKLPLDWSNMFSLIHQRLLVAALREDEWGLALAEMMRTLLPGGWVQLGEVGSWSAGPFTDKHFRLVQQLFKSKGLMLDCARHIPDMLSTSGFVNIQTVERTIPLGKWAGEEGVKARDNFIGVFNGMKTPILNAGGLGVVGSENEFDALLGSVEEEWDDTRNSTIEFHVFYAQKPFMSSSQE